MSSVSCRDARLLLSAALGGSSVPPSAAWTELLSRQAVAGTNDHPTLTPIGQHVLAELEIRAYRCDDQPLDLLAEELTRVLGELEGTAKNAEYLLTDLGPITRPRRFPTCGS